MTGTTVASTALDTIDPIAEKAAVAAPVWASTTPRRRAKSLVAIADALMAASAELVGIGVEETGLTEARLTGELKRTAVQLRLFAEAVLDGGYLDVRIDEADPNFALGVRPDLRRYRIPVGPVLNFAASNFPFAFSVAGGDSAAALAAGCPVIVKAHSGHPRLSVRTADVVRSALHESGAPDGTFQLISGQQAGVAMLNHVSIAAGSFTGSIRVGRMLADIAAARPTPIPFFGELGSVNPVFVTRAAIAGDATGIADDYIASVSGSAGQLCTKPGFLFLPAGHGLGERMAVQAGAVAEHRLLNPSISAGYRERRDAVLSASGITVIASGSLRIDQAGHGWATPTIVSVGVNDILAQRATLAEESFGPLSIVIEYGDDDLVEVADQLFDGNLTGTIHSGPADDSSIIRPLIDWVSRHTGRVLFGGWPTGVAVTPAMTHGGPWPATTNDSSTSVGSSAISRFTRPVTYQDAPAETLPEPLLDSNPWGVPQLRTPAGQSHQWGATAG